jgi:Cu(I)/Ag(I) efflux system membrane fusion protein
MNHKGFAFIGGALTLLAGALLLSVRASAQHEHAASDESPQNADREPLYWYDPMRPEVHFEHPGRSPFMDMPLQPKYADEGARGGAGVVSVDPRMLQNLGVRTAKVERSTLGGGLQAVGLVEIDERRIVVVEARAAGWIEQLAVRTQGEVVKRGQRLATLYSPELYAARGELQLAQNGGDAELAAAARERLRLLGAGTGHGAQTALLSPNDGVVIELLAREGAQVAPGAPLMKLADQSRVWVRLQLPQAQAAALRAGADARIAIADQPGREWHGRIEYVYPAADPATRTLSARITVDNAEGLLKPSQYASVQLGASDSAPSLSVPTQAVIRSGSGARVIVALGAGRFEPRAVTLGREAGERSEILAGIQEGESVVSSGQFLIDSEANLQGALARLQPPEAPQ